MTNPNNNQSPAVTPLAPWRAILILLRSLLVDLGHKILRRRKRDSAQVASDYDRGEWLDQMNARAWERAPTLRDYVVPASDRAIVATVDHRLVEISQREYYAYRTQCLSDVLARHAGDVADLVEIGSGAGRNLFALACDSRWSSLRGLELSKTGIEVTRIVAQHYQLTHVSATPINLLDPSSAGFAELRGATAFSFYCLEQLPAHTEAVLTALVRSGVRRVIHIEPTAELYSRFSLKDLVTVSYIWRQHYLNDIVSVAKRLEARGVIRILAIERLGFAPTIRNAPTLVVWEPAVA